VDVKRAVVKDALPGETVATGRSRSAVPTRMASANAETIICAG
jgi:hypothetical protein